MHEETDLVEMCTIDYATRNFFVGTDEKGALKAAPWLFIDRWLYRYSATHFRLTRIGIRCAHTDR